MTEDELRGLATSSNSGGERNEAYSVLAETWPIPKFGDRALELALQKDLPTFLRIRSHRKGTYPFLQYRPQVWGYLSRNERDDIFGRLAYLGGRWEVQFPPIGFLLGFWPGGFRRDGQNCMPFGQAAGHPTPDMFPCEVLRSADAAPNEAIHQSILEASQQRRCETMLGQ
jgi:hypothetical protein